MPYQTTGVANLEEAREIAKKIQEDCLDRAIVQDVAFAQWSRKQALLEGFFGIAVLAVCVASVTLGSFHRSVIAALPTILAFTAIRVWGWIVTRRHKKAVNGYHNLAAGCRIFWTFEASALRTACKTEAEKEMSINRSLDALILKKGRFDTCGFPVSYESLKQARASRQSPPEHTEDREDT